MKLFYKLTGTGWANAVVSDGDSRLEISSISYLSDAFKDLVKAAVGLLQGSERVFFLWHDEPGEHRWILDRVGDELTICIRWFDDAFDALPDEQGKEVFRFKCQLADFTGEIVACGHALLAEHGTEGYRDEWGSEFPEEEFERLKWLINKMGCKTASTQRARP